MSETDSIGVVLTSCRMNIPTTAWLIEQPIPDARLHAMVAIEVPGQGNIYAYVVDWTPSADVEIDHRRQVNLTVTVERDQFRATHVQLHDVSEDDPERNFFYPILPT